MFPHHLFLYGTDTDTEITTRSMHENNREKLNHQLCCNKTEIINRQEFKLLLGRVKWKFKCFSGVFVFLHQASYI